LVKFTAEHVLHFDLKPGDRFYYFTTTGWNVWYLLTSVLAADAVALMYDGSPFHPKSDVIFDMADAENMTVLGTSPKYIEGLRKLNVKPIATHRLASLRTVVTTGSPLSVDGFDYVYRSIKKNVRLSSVSGGTEMVSTLANGNPLGPVWRGELQARALGMKAEVYDDNGRPVVEQKGELVVTAPFPSRPLRFWNDPGNARYHETYFSRFPNVWWHGDFAEITKHDGLIIHGRSDATLNPGGVRIGTAEIYRAVEELDGVVDSIVVGQDWQDDVRVVLFVKLREGRKLDDALVRKIKNKVRDYATPRHVPAKVIQVADIPYTINGKKVELAVRNLIHGRPVRNTGSLANPQALELFRDLAELR
jgi:acetoacetyl-CoA synthetase